ncbi:methyltransferase [Pokkaliibacter sp. CJK22405]|uniref:methyltransferase n=1 Tax=Pokkaliibacter sp. CJK22405 TaxID=3384615 RepID=UPI00398463C0
MSASNSWMPVNQMLWRNESLLGDQPLLVVNPPELAGWQDYKTSATFFTQDFRVHGLFEAAGLNSYFAAFPKAEPGVSSALLYWPKSKELGRMLLAAVASILGPKGVILIAGEHQGGVKSAQTIAEELCGQKVIKLDNARRCTLYRIETADAIMTFDAAKWLSTLDIEVQQERYKVLSYPGVFSHAELDEATKMLLEIVSLPESGRCLDFGCGAGVIGAVVASRKPGLTVEMLDVNALALESSRLTCEANGVVARVFASNAWSEAEGKYDVILSNPPFHTGLKLDFRPAAELIKAARKHLHFDGDLTLVANGFLPYESWLAESFRKVHVVSENSRFKVYKARG